MAKYDIMKIPNDNTTNLKDYFFLREINTLLKFQKDCIQDLENEEHPVIVLKQINTRFHLFLSCFNH